MKQVHASTIGVLSLLMLAFVSRLFADDIINNRLSLIEQKTAFSPTAVPGGPAGTFTITATFKNVSAGPIGGLFFSVATLTGGNVFLNRTGGTGGVGSTLTVPLVDGYSDGVLGSSEAVKVDFVIGLAARAAFQFFVDALISSSLPVNLEITAGQQEITLLAGQSASTAFILDVSNQLGGIASVFATQSVFPSSGLSIVTDLPAMGFSTSTASESFLVQNQFTGVASGDYIVTLNGTLTAAAQSRKAASSITVHVLPASGIGDLNLTAHPGGLKTSSTSEVTFGANYSLGTTKPTSVHLNEVSSAGAFIQSMGEMKDDGVSPDVGAGDLIYTVQPVLAAGSAGTARYFQAVAIFPGGSALGSPVISLPTVPYNIGLAPVNPNSVVAEVTTGVQIVCDQVLIVFQPGLSLSIIESVITSVGGGILGVEPNTNVYQVSIACNGLAGVQTVLNSLNTNPFVISASPNTIKPPSEMKPDDSKYESQFAPQLVRAAEAWLIARGKGIVVAVLDSGVDYNHADLNGQIAKGYDYFNDDDDPQDDVFHGTHVAGIVAARGNNGQGIAGIAWDAKVLAIKVCGPRFFGLISNGCTDSAMISGLAEAKTKAKIVNMSIAGPKNDFEKLLNLIGKKSALQIAIEETTNTGVLIVASAGNTGTSDPQLPCAYPGVLCVGNSTDLDVRWTGTPNPSTYGTHVDIAAPGVSILSTVPTSIFSSGYVNATGTSMSSPMVAGVAALVWANNPTWTATQVRDRLLKTAKPLSNEQIGPRVDAFDAVFNGNFEHGLSGWKVTGTGSAVNKLGPINPTKDKFMGLASTGPDAVVSSSDLFQEFTIQPDVSEIAISFEYAMITEEFPEFVGTVFNDDLRITLEEKVGGRIHELALETVNTSSFVSLGGIDFPGGDRTVGWTGWKSVNSKKIAVTPGGGTYRLRVRDRGDGIFDTNGILDNVRFK